MRCAKCRLLPIVVVGALAITVGHASGETADSIPEPRIITITDGSPGVKWIMERIGVRPGLLTSQGDRLLVATSEVDFSEDGSVEATGEGGTLLCLDKGTGKHIWNRNHARRDNRERLLLGIQSTPRIDGDYVYYVSNRGELVCAGLKDGKVEWLIDMLADLGVSVRPDPILANRFCTPLVYGDHVYCITGNGCNFHTPDPFNLPLTPDAPHFICVHKRTGKLVWSNAAPGKDVVYSWCSPVLVSLADKDAIVFPGGDGVLYFFDPLKGNILFRHDVNLPDATRWTKFGRGSQVFFSGVPIVHDEMLFVGTCQDMYGYPTNAPFVCIDLNQVARKGPNVERWRIRDERLGWTRASPVVFGDRIFIFDDHQFAVLSVDIKTGEIKGHRETHRAETSPFHSLAVVDGKLLVNTGESVEIFSASDALTPISRVEFDSVLMGNVLIADSTLFAASASRVVAVELQAILGDGRR